MYCLFEIGVFCARFYVGKRRRSDVDAEDDEQDQAS
jgi:sec-independent protein translocase protein TatC